MCLVWELNLQQNVWMKVRNAVKAWSPFAVQFKKKYYPWVQLAGHEGEIISIKGGLFV